MTYVEILYYQLISSLSTSFVVWRNFQRLLWLSKFFSFNSPDTLQDSQLLFMMAILSSSFPLNPYAVVFCEISDLRQPYRFSQIPKILLNFQDGYKVTNFEMDTRLHCSIKGISSSLRISGSTLAHIFADFPSIKVICINELTTTAGECLQCLSW
jgi:hypothetical protein